MKERRRSQRLASEECLLEEKEFGKQGGFGLRLSFFSCLQFFF